MIASHNALSNSTFMPLETSGLLRLTCAMPSAIRSRTGPLSITGKPIFPPLSLAPTPDLSDQERQREERLLVVGQGDLLVRHAQLATDVTQPIFIPRGPDGIVPKAGFEHHAVASSANI